MHVFLTLCFLLALSLSAQADVVIGVAGPMKGPYAGLGEQIKRGADAAVADINAAGGLNGQHLKLLVEDDGCDAKQAVLVAQKLVAAGVKFVDGHYCSASSMAAAPIYAEAGIIMISPASTYPKFTDEGSWNTNRIVARDDQQGDFAGQVMSRAFAGQHVAILNDGTPLGAALARRFKAALNASNQKEVANVAYKPGQNNYDEIVNALLGADTAAVYIGGYAADAGTITRRLRDLASNAVIVGSNLLLVEQYWQVAGQAGEDTLGTFTQDPSTIVQAWPLTDRLKSAGQNADGATVQAYAAVEAYAAAAKATQGFDGHAISTWLRAGNVVTTVLGRIAFDNNGDVKDPGFSWYHWQAGKITAIENFPTSVAP